MRLPLGWLRDYVAFDEDASALAARFARLGFPVVDVERKTRLSGVVVGRLTKVVKHPGADRLQVCTVDVGSERALTIATAATNVAAGDIVPVATVGAQLVGLTIAPRTMRGIASEGMLCSASEVGLPADWFEDGILQLDDEVPIGADFVHTFGLDHDVFDVEVTANRVDAMSVLGLARELAASLGTQTHEPATTVPPAAVEATPADAITIASDDCRRVVAVRVSDIAARRSPFWMRSRLALAGQRPIDALVDVSNFVMLESAQPLHFYDYETLAGRRLVVRDARDGEQLRTLDGNERALDPRFLVLADERQPQCIAGLMGAAASEVTPATREILIEAATFSGPRVRRMSVALGLRTEASSRHEKGLPPRLADWGAARAAHLLARSGATVHGAAIAGAAETPATGIALPLRRLYALLGIRVDAGESEAVLRGLGFGVAREGETLHATPPPWRSDVRIAEDVVEEIARVVGYDRIVAEIPPVFEHGVSSGAYRDEMRVAHALAALGYTENVTLSLQPASVAERYASAGIALDARVVELMNPLSEEQRYLRFSLVPGLLGNALRQPRGVKTFEIGRVFSESEPDEIPGVVWLSTGEPVDEPAWRDSGFLAFKSDALALVRRLCGRDADVEPAGAAGWHPGKTASLTLDGRTVATAGALDPRLLAAYGFDGRAYAGCMRLAEVPAHRMPRYHAPSRFPPVTRDLAVVVTPDVTARRIEHAVRAGANGTLAAVDVFDEYRGAQVADGKKSVTVRVVLQRDDATLTDADAQALVDGILAALRDRCGAVIRT